MVIKEETLEYLEKNNLSEIINIVKSRDLYGKLDDNLNNDIINKHKKKI
jgi:hypothetical protein